MNEYNQKINETRKFVEKELSCTAHYLDHTERVYNLCLLLAKDDPLVDLEVLELASLLHDVARVKEDNDSSGKTDHAILGAQMARDFLKTLNFSEDKIKSVETCIMSHRYRTENKPQTKEAKILFDADKLDAVGAVGVARALIWVGKNNAKLYTNCDIEEYIKENLCGKINGRIQDVTKHSIQIEYETKSKFLIEKLFTDKAKAICKDRLDFHKSFLIRLEKEINGQL